MNIHHYFGVVEDLSYVWIRKYGSYYYDTCVTHGDLAPDDSVYYRMKNTIFKLNVTYQEMLDASNYFVGVDDKTTFLVFSPEARRFFVVRGYDDEEDKEWLIQESKDSLMKNLHRFVTIVPKKYLNTFMENQETASYG